MSTKLGFCSHPSTKSDNSLFQDEVTQRSKRDLRSLQLHTKGMKWHNEKTQAQPGSLKLVNL